MEHITIKCDTATDPFHTADGTITSTLYELKSSWKLTLPDPLILFKSHNIQEQYIPFN